MSPDLNESRACLTALYTYFHNQFVRHVFPRISPSTRISDLSKVASVAYLIGRLEELENASKVNALEAELNLGRYESKTLKQEAGIDAGIPTGKEASKEAEHPQMQSQAQRGPKEALLGHTGYDAGGRGEDTGGVTDPKRSEPQQRFVDAQTTQPQLYGSGTKAEDTTYEPKMREEEVKTGTGKRHTQHTRHNHTWSGSVNDKRCESPRSPD